MTLDFFLRFCLSASLLLPILGFSFDLYASNYKDLRKIIYGEDSRTLYEHARPTGLKSLGDSVALVIGHRSLSPTSKSKTLSLRLSPPPHFCEGERFSDHYAALNSCTGFLIAPDILATANHCLTHLGVCSDLAFVFGYTKPSKGPHLEVPQKNVFRCKSVLKRRGDSRGDFALLQLDRNAPRSRPPLELEPGVSIEVGTPLGAIGHSLGLSMMFVTGAQVRINYPSASYFIANTDTFGGNSGSPIINMETMQVAGLLVSGGDDFVEKSGCIKLNRVKRDGYPGEQITKAAYFDK